MTPRGERQGGVRLTVAALLLVLGGALGTVAYGIAHQVGHPPEAPLPTASRAADRAGRTASAPSRGSDPSTPGGAPSASSPGTSLPAALPPSAPVSVEIPSIRVDSSVFPVGLQDDGALAVPSGDRADDVAWFQDSPTPGEIGPSVLEGHVTYGDDRSVFFDLGSLEAGQTITVHREDGSRADFEVYRVERFPKSRFPTQEVYANTPGPELRVITCGGDVGSNGHHLDNTIVFARLRG